MVCQLTTHALRQKSAHSFGPLSGHISIAFMALLQFPCMVGTPHRDPEKPGLSARDSRFRWSRSTCTVLNSSMRGSWKCVQEPSSPQLELRWGPDAAEYLWSYAPCPFLSSRHGNDPVWRMSLDLIL